MGFIYKAKHSDRLPCKGGNIKVTEGLKVTHNLFKFHILPRNPSGLP